MRHARLSSTKAPLLLGLRYRACVVMWVVQVGERPNPPPQAVSSQMEAYLLTASQEPGRVGVNRIVGLSADSSVHRSVSARLQGYLWASIGSEEKTCYWSYWGFYFHLFISLFPAAWKLALTEECVVSWCMSEGIGNLCWDKSVRPSRNRLSSSVVLSPAWAIASSVSDSMLALGMSICSSVFLKCTKA